MSLFLSYSSDDRGFAAQLHEALSKYIKVFFDTQSIPGGAAWEREIDQAIRDCNVFIPIVTKSSNNSTWVTKETLLALSLKAPIVPVLLSDSLPLRIVDRQFVDFRESFETGFADLLETLSNHVGRLETTPEEVDALIANAVRERLSGNIRASNAFVEQFVGPNSDLATDGYWFWRKLHEAINTNHAETITPKLWIKETTHPCSEEETENSDYFRWRLELHGTPDELDVVDSVVYTLHPTFPSPVQKVRSREKFFGLERIGWGVFLVKIRIQFIDYTAFDGKFMLTFREEHQEPILKPNEND